MNLFQKRAALLKIAQVKSAMRHVLRGRFVKRAAEAAGTKQEDTLKIPKAVQKLPDYNPDILSTITWDAPKAKPEPWKPLSENQGQTAIRKLMNPLIAGDRSTDPFLSNTMRPAPGTLSTGNMSNPGAWKLPNDAYNEATGTTSFGKQKGMPRINLSDLTGTSLSSYEPFANTTDDVGPLTLDDTGNVVSDTKPYRGESLAEIFGPREVSLDPSMVDASFARQYGPRSSKMLSLFGNPAGPALSQDSSRPASAFENLNARTIAPAVDLTRDDNDEARQQFIQAASQRLSEILRQRHRLSQKVNSWFDQSAAFDAYQRDFNAGMERLKEMAYKRFPRYNAEQLEELKRREATRNPDAAMNRVNELMNQQIDGLLD